MLAWFNGHFMPEEEAVVSIFDRGFLYGDGLFETVRVYGGKPFLWEEHMRRWRAGRELLRLSSPLDERQLRGTLSELLARNSIQDAIARITLSRGTGPRGYSPEGANHPTLALTLHPAPGPEPRRLKVITSTLKLLSKHPLSRAKHANKLLQILARAEAGAAGADEALLLNERGEVAEATGANLFWIQENVLATPPLWSGALPGITRRFVIELGLKLQMDVAEIEIHPAGLLDSDGAFLTSAALEIAEITEIGGHPLSGSPNVTRLQSAYRRATIE